MEYELKFYLGEDLSNVTYLGKLSLSNEATYLYYLELLNSKQNASIWFHADAPLMHRNIKINNNTFFSEGTTGNDLKVIYILINDSKDVLLFTDEEYNNSKRIDEFISGLSKEDFNRFLK